MRSLHRKNALLQSLQSSCRKLLLADLERVEIKAHSRLCAAGHSLTNTCFPTSAVISARCDLNGKTMDVHGVGREGIVGPSVLFIAEQSRFEWVCQIGGSMLLMPSSIFEQHVRKNAGLQRAVALYSMGVIGLLTQSIACNGLHSIAQRCARWLLITGDRVDASEFSLTHEQLARMLGVRRSGVSVAVQRLQRLGIIRYRLGRIYVVDRDRLELESCECYRLVVLDTERIFRAGATKRRSLTPKR